MDTMKVIDGKYMADSQTLVTSASPKMMRSVI